MALKYTTTLQLAEILGIINQIPSWDIGSDTPTNEAVGTGTGSQAVFYLDNKNILAGTYTLYANGSAMTETTHYVLDKENGTITLTSAGITLLATNALTAKYKYINNDMTDAYLQTVLERSEAEVDNRVNSSFTDGTASNPTYPTTTEIQPSNGYFVDRFITNKKPLIDISTTLDGAHTSIITTISLATGTGVDFPTTGSIIVGSEVITYTGVDDDDLTGCTRGAYGTTAAAYVGDEPVHSTIFFRSNTSEGTDVTWTVQPWDSSMYASEEGLIYKFKDADPDSNTKSGVENRLKIIYYYGYDTIPSDIVRLTLILAKRMLIQDNVGKSMIAGRNEFRPEMFDIDESEINRIINSYIILPMINT